MERYLPLLQELKRKGIEKSWLVGGVVRDLLIGREASDIDIVCQGSSIEELLQHIGGVVIGKPPLCTLTVQLLGKRVEISLLTGNSIENDLARRDFTLNAIAADINGQLIDPFAGSKDIAQHTLRLLPASLCPYEADPLRIVRLLRFACTLGFTISAATEHQTLYFIRHYGNRLKEIPQERFGKEFLKGFAARPFDFLTLLEQYELLSLLIPQLEAMRGLEQPPEFHPEGDVLAHTFLTVSQAQACIVTKQPASDPVLAFSALLHDVGKPVSAAPHPKYARTCFFGHEETGEQIARTMLTAWGISDKITQPVTALIRNHMLPGQIFTERTAVKLFRRLGHGLSKRLFELSLCDALGAMGTGENMRLAEETYLRVANKLMSTEQTSEGKQKRLMNGHDIMDCLKLPPSPLVGKFLEELDIAIAENKVRTREEAESWLNQNKSKLLPQDDARQI